MTITTSDRHFSRQIMIILEFPYKPLRAFWRLFPYWTNIWADQPAVTKSSIATATADPEKCWTRWFQFFFLRMSWSTAKNSSPEQNKSQGIRDPISHMHQIYVLYLVYLHLVFKDLKSMVNAWYLDIGSIDSAYYGKMLLWLVYSSYKAEYLYSLPLSWPRMFGWIPTCTDVDSNPGGKTSR